MRRLPGQAARQRNEFAIALVEFLATGLAQGLCGAADFQNAPLGRAPMVNHFQGSRFACAANPFEAARQHADAIGQKRTVGGMMNVGFHGRGIGAQLLSGGDRLLPRDLNDSGMNLRGSVLAEESKGAGETGKIRDGVFVKPSKAAIKQAGPQFLFQLTEGPALEVFEDDATQQPVRSNGGAAEISGTGAALGQGLSGHLN